MFLRLYTTKFISFIFIIALLELFIATTTNISSSKTLIIRHYPVGAFIPSMTSRRNQQQQSSRHYSSTSSSDKRRRQEQNDNNNAPRKNNNNEEQNPSVNHNQQQEQQTTKKKKNDDESQRQQQQQHRREATTDAAPMYITIGPQCCGKSTFLRNLNGGKIKDISLDDQQDVYVPIATDLFLHAYDDNNENDNENENDNKDKNTKELQHVYQGKSLLTRIRDNVELILILRRWNLDSTAIDFEQRILKYYRERNLSTTVAQALVVAIEDFLSTTTTTTTTTNTKPPEMPRETDVFILESLFKPHPETRQSAIQTSYDELRKTPKHIPIAWGNTNAKAKDYERALEIAHQTRRPVKFILCHPEYSDRNDGELLTLPWVPLDELLKRNLYRLQSQGRYIPAFAIADCCQRVTAMVPPNYLAAAAATTTAAAASDSNPNNVQQFLVGLASPSNTGGRQQNTNNNRQRNNNQKRSGASFKYILTKHYLIQKQYPKQNNQHNYNNNDTTTTRRMNNSHNYNDEGKNSRQRQHHINAPGSTFNRNNSTNSTTRT